MEKEKTWENVLKMFKLLKMCSYQLFVPGTVPSLRAERDLDPDQPAGHHAHHLPPQVTIIDCATSFYIDATIVNCYRKLYKDFTKTNIEALRVHRLFSLAVKSEKQARY